MAVGAFKLSYILQVLDGLNQPSSHSNRIEQELPTLRSIHRKHIDGLLHIVVVRKSIVQGDLDLVRGAD